MFGLASSSSMSLALTGMKLSKKVLTISSGWQLFCYFLTFRASDSKFRRRGDGLHGASLDSELIEVFRLDGS